MTIRDPEYLHVTPDSSVSVMQYSRLGGPDWSLHCWSIQRYFLDRYFVSLYFSISFNLSSDTKDRGGSFVTIHDSTLFSCIYSDFPGLSLWTAVSGGTNPRARGQRVLSEGLFYPFSDR